MPKRPAPDYQSSYVEPPTPPAAILAAPTPLAIILATMHRKYADGDHDGAVALARIAAPYLHPKIPAAIPATDLAAMPDAELDALKAPP